MGHTTFETMPSAIDDLRNGQSRLEQLVSKLLNQQPQRDKDEFLTLKQVCELTGYAAASVYGMIGANKIPHFKRGQRLFFDRDAIINWIKEGKRKNKGEIEAEADSRLQKLKIKR